MNISKEARRISERCYGIPRKDEPALLTKYRKKAYTRILRILKEEEDKETIHSMDEFRGQYFPKEQADIKTKVEHALSRIRAVLAYPRIDPLAALKELEKILSE